MTTALILVDIQNDYFPNGNMELSQPEQAAANAAKVLEQFRTEHKDLIFHVQHIAADPAMGFFLPDTNGVEIHEAVKPKGDESVTIKHFPNSFLQTDLESKLKEKGVTDLVVVGMMTHMCIDATVRAAVDMGYKVTLIEDACATRELSYADKTVTAEQVQYAFVGALNGMYAQVTSAEAFLG
ncbi:cysteine hydrolase family protein [Saccharibacillus qingshengii]|uniref:cysteine hydrolase family protein n=1 Tax=Saccharibacillus qingshengii TaxID=1763540 RepID=UPI0015537ADA|nr:cysteine hydrolase family protein [Saccharibacillus qingshengii]